MRCCYDKWIPLNPYDLIRLAHGFGIGTGEFIRRHTTEGVRLLRREEEPGNPCVFLGDEGCTVHAHRPAVCRLYPLGQTTMPDGSVTFSHLTPHPETAGVYGRDGAVGDYLAAQGYEPYEKAAQAYGELYDDVAVSLSKTDAEVLEESPGDEAPHLLDVDAWIQSYCAAEGLEFPIDPDEKYILHIRAMRAWLATVET